MEELSENSHSSVDDHAIQIERNRRDSVELNSFIPGKINSNFAIEQRNIFFNLLIC